MKPWELKMVPFGSSDYDKTVALRYLLLRQPLGLAFSKSELQKENAMYHLAYFNSDKACIACLILVPEENGYIKMRQVAVAPNYQSKGIGKQFIKDTEKFAIRKGFNKIYCHARSSALPFYKKLNYKVLSNEFIEVGIPHFKLEKVLC